MALMYTGAGGELGRGVHIGEHWNTWQNRFVQKNFGEQQ